jgi:hypothetical protein
MSMSTAISASFNLASASQNYSAGASASMRGDYAPLLFTGLGGRWMPVQLCSLPLAEGARMGGSGALAMTREMVALSAYVNKYGPLTA